MIHLYFFLHISIIIKVKESNGCSRRKKHNHFYERRLLSQSINRTKSSGFQSDYTLYGLHNSGNIPNHFTNSFFCLCLFFTLSSFLFCKFKFAVANLLEIRVFVNVRVHFDFFVSRLIVPRRLW